MCFNITFSSFSCQGHSFRSFAYFFQENKVQTIKERKQKRRNVHNSKNLYALLRFAAIKKQVIASLKLTLQSRSIFPVFQPCLFSTLLRRTRLYFLDFWSAANILGFLGLVVAVLLFTVNGEEDKSANKQPRNFQNKLKTSWLDQQFNTRVSLISFITPRFQFTVSTKVT